MIHDEDSNDGRVPLLPKNQRSSAFQQQPRECSDTVSVGASARSVFSHNSSFHHPFPESYHAIEDVDHVTTPRHPSSLPKVPAKESFAPTRGDSKPLFAAKVAAVALLFPCIGTFLAYFAFIHRNDPTFLLNRGDWRVMYVVGVALQLAVACPLALLIDNDEARSSLLSLPTHGDYYGPLVMYPLVCLFFVVLTMVYYGLRISGAFAARERLIEDEQKHLRMNKTNFMINLKAELREKTEVRSELLVIVSTAIALAQVLFMRSCLLINSTTEGFCDSGQSMLFSSVRYRNSVYVWIATVFWFLLFFVVDLIVLLAVLAYYQELRQVELFTMTTRGNDGGFSQQHSAIMRDLYDPRNLAAWAALWEMLVKEVKHNPVTESLRSTTFLANVISFLASLLYIGITNVNSERGVAEFTNGCISVAAISLFGWVSFIYITAKLQNAIQSHETTISKVANDCQCAQMMSRHDSVEAKQLRSKVLVLQTLDLYNRAAARYPKLLGLSLETLRWSIIIFGLATLDFFFLFLFVVDCPNRHDE